MTETTQVTQAELLPCPFCGADAELERGNDHHGHWFNLGCSRHWGRQRNPDHTNTCIAGRMFYTETDVPEAEAITAWNTRIEAARPVSGEPVGYIIADMLNRKSEFERNGIVMTAAPQGMSTLPLYAARPVQSELVEALRMALEWIDAVPSEVRAALPAMPGFDRDWADQALTKATGDGL